MPQTKPFLWLMLVLGVALIVLPFAMGLPSKASHGQTMIDEFRPIMEPSAVAKTVDYYDKTFVPLRGVAEGGIQAAGEVPKMIGALSEALRMSPDEVQQFLGTFPALGGLLGQLGQLEPIFTNVPPGLDHYKPLVDTMKANVTNYEKIDSLPNFRMFTWFFVIPGVLLVLLAGLALGAAGRAPAGGRAA